MNELEHKTNHTKLVMPVKYTYSGSLINTFLAITRFAFDGNPQFIKGEFD